MESLIIYVFVAILVYGVFIAIRDGFVYGILAVVKILAKILYWCTIGVPIWFVKTLIEGERKDKTVGVSRETITITDSFKDRKGRTVRVNKTINVGAKSVTERELNRIR